MVADKILAYLSLKERPKDEQVKREIEKLAGIAFERQFQSEDKKKDGLRLSSSGKCVRQLAYGLHGFEASGKELDSRARLVFWAGDLTEMTLVALAKVAGCQITATGFGQLKVKLTIAGKEIEGHPDGLLLEGNELLLLEVKSMSSYAYERFEKGFIDPSYLAQINCYMEALGVHRCVFLAQNKDSGVISEKIVDKNDELMDLVEVNLTTVITSTKENLPERPYQPDAKGLYPWMCAYCAYHKTCLIEPKLAEKVVVNGSYKLKVVVVEAKK